MPDDQDEPFAPIDTARLQLRCIRDTDAPALSALMHPEVSRWMASWPVPFPVEHAAARIAKARRAAAAGTEMPCAVIRRAGEVLIGWLAVTRLTPGRGAVAHWYGLDHHGQGYAKEALAAGIAAGFARFDLDVIEASLQHANAASIAVVRACGMVFVREGEVYAETRARQETVLFYEVIRKR